MPPNLSHRTAVVTCGVVLRGISIPIHGMVLMLQS